MPMPGKRRRRSFGELMDAPTPSLPSTPFRPSAGARPRRRTSSGPVVPSAFRVMREASRGKPEAPKATPSARIVKRAVLRAQLRKRKKKD